MKLLANILKLKNMNNPMWWVDKLVIVAMIIGYRYGNHFFNQIEYNADGESAFWGILATVGVNAVVTMFGIGYWSIRKLFKIMSHRKNIYERNSR